MPTQMSLHVFNETLLTVQYLITVGSYFAKKNVLFCSSVFQFGVHVFWGVLFIQYSKSSPVAVASSGFLVWILGG